MHLDVNGLAAELYGLCYSDGKAYIKRWREIKEQVSKDTFEQIRAQFIQIRDDRKHLR